MHFMLKCFFFKRYSSRHVHEEIKLQERMNGID